jgi:PAS domain S-box-containing protein
VLSEDITARKEAEELRARSERELLQLAELIPQICWTNDVEGKVDFTNQRWVDYTGQTQVDWPAVVHAEDLPRVAEEVRKAREEERDYELEYRLRRRDGVYRWHLARSVVVRDEKGRQQKRLGTATDIHDQKTVEAELMNAVHVRDEFVSIASHELRTPLTSLALRLQRRRMLLNRGQRQTTEQILADTGVEERQVQRLTRLVDDLLDVTRIASGNLRLQPEPADLAEITADVLLRFRELVEMAGCSISYEAQSVRGVWDRERLEQIAVNLLTNAARYAAGKPVSVRVEALPGKARLQVSDRGSGIAPADHERIFERFERAAASRHLPGMGLGLYVSRQIARAHGGDIRVESQLGQGATFIVELPSAP